MKRPIFIIAFISVLLTLLEFTACRKDDESNTKTKSDFLIEGNWVITNLTVEPGIDMGGGVLVTDVYPYLEDCQKDDIMDFQSGGDVVIDEGPTKCDPDDPQTTDRGSWMLMDNNTKLRITEPNGDSFEGTILELTATRFIWTYQQSGVIKAASWAPYQYTMSMQSK